MRTMASENSRGFCWQVVDSKWWPETGSNRRRRPFQGRALPLSYLALAWIQGRSEGPLKGVSEAGRAENKDCQATAYRQTTSASITNHGLTVRIAQSPCGFTIDRQPV